VLCRPMPSMSTPIPSSSGQVAASALAGQATPRGAGAGVWCDEV
jgi:hypothetical protein